MTKSSPHKKTLPLPNLILKNLVTNEEYTRKTLPFLYKEYFEEDHHRIVFEEIDKFVKKYNTLPTKQALIIDLAKVDSLQRNEKLASLVVNEISNAFSNNNNEEEESITSLEWLLNATEGWCQERAIYNSVVKSLSILDGDDKVLSKHAIPKLLQDALNVTFDTHIGHDYIENFEERFEFYRKKEDRLPFDIDILNKITNGGIPRKTLSVISSSTGVGKSLILCHFTADYLVQSKNVLYITMEMAEERIAERIDANLMDIPVNDLYTMSKKVFEDRIESIKQKSTGRLMIKEFPTSGAHVGHFRALIDELRTKKNFVPDVIMIDYLNICASSKIKSIGGSINTYSYVKSIAEEIRGLAIEYDLPIWSATQTNRQSANNSDADITNISESFGTAQTVDLLLGVLSTEELQEKGQLLFKQFKNRFGAPDKYNKFFLGVDRPKMKIYELEDSAANGGQNQYSPPVPDGKDSRSLEGMINKESVGMDFSNFKM